MSDTTYARFKPFDMTTEEVQALPPLPGHLTIDELVIMRKGAGVFTSPNLPPPYRGRRWMPVGLVERRWLVVRPEDGHEKFVVDLGPNARCPMCGRYDR